MFDEDAARACFLSGLVADRTSTQSWNVEAWSAGWRDASGALRPGKLGETGGGWWFRALTDTGRLTAEPEEISSDPLTSVGARARIAAFVGEANQILVHWPMSALAPIAFPLREALGLNEALAVLAESLPHDGLAEFVPWLGPVDANVAERWMTEVSAPALIESLCYVSGEYRRGLERLRELGALETADAVAECAPPEDRAAWVLEANRPVSLDLFDAAASTVDDETFAALASKVLRKRDRRVWEVLIARPLPALATRVLEQHADPVAPWVYRFFEAGDEPMLDALIELAQRRGKLGAAAVKMLSQLDRTSVQLRVDALPDDTRTKLQAKLEPNTRDLPELPRSAWPNWMTTVSQRAPTTTYDWLDPVLLPPLATQDGYRLSSDVQRGILALLQEVRFDVSGQGSTPDRYDSALDELRGLLDMQSANAWWNALFAMWWTNHRPEVRWVMYAAAFLCDGPAIRDLGAKLRRHRTWFGNLSSRVIAALGQNPTPWAVAALDDIAHRSTNPAHRELAGKFLARRAAVSGVTVDRYVSLNYPNEHDPVLIDAAARRTEHAMVEQKTWTDYSLSEYLRIAPFAYVSESIVWSVSEPWSDDLAFFCVRDGAFEDPLGARIDLSHESTITVAHPAQLEDDELRQWHTYCADHEIVQAFGQLERSRFRASTLSRDGFRSPVGAGLNGREFIRRAKTLGWVPMQRGAHGGIVGVTRVFAAMDACAELRFEDPLEQDGSGESNIAGIVFTSSRGEPLDSQDVPAVAFSEAHHDITRMVNIP